MFKFVLILAILPAVVFGKIKFTACNEGGPQPDWLAIEGCDEDSLCLIYNRVPVKMTGQITTQYAAEELTSSLVAFINIVTLPLELPPEIVDGCNALGGGCPVAEDETRSLTAEFVVDSPLNNIKPFIQLKIVNEEKTVVMCVRTQVDLQNPQNP